MILWFLAYLGGLLTVLSPCILPVLPFVFSRADGPFRKSGLPLLAGMALTFAAVSTLAVVGGSWAIQANEWGRWAALVLLSLFALTLLSPHLAEAISRPFTRLGSRLSQTHGEERGAGGSFLLGIATGFLWAPCAGPILGLILTSAALHGAHANTTFLLLAYALGAATSLAAALLVGGKLLGAMRKYLGADAWVRKILGMAVLFGVAAIVLGWDRGVLTGISRVSTESLEQRLLHWIRPSKSELATAHEEGMPQENVLLKLKGAVQWINSAPLTPEMLKGKVVLVDFWTYSCINCLRSLPYVKAWAEKYQDSGLVVVGVHTPEFAFEKNAVNVENAVRELGIHYPVAIDNDYAIWRAFDNRYWPAHYFIDASGKIRHQHFGEGEYAESEKIIQDLLKEAQSKNVPSGLIQAEGSGVLAPSSEHRPESPETYVGYSRAKNLLTSPSLNPDQPLHYSLQVPTARNQWSLGGRWKVQAEHAELVSLPGKIVFRFHARDLHLVLGPGEKGRPIRFVVTLDGAAPGDHHGSDMDEKGRGVVREQRLYQLIRQQGKDEIVDRLFEIEFIDPGVQAFAFTFG